MLLVCPKSWGADERCLVFRSAAAPATSTLDVLAIEPVTSDEPELGVSKRRGFLSRGEIVAGKYRIVKRLDFGGVAGVYLAQTLPIGEGSRQVVIRIDKGPIPSAHYKKFADLARAQTNGHLFVEVTGQTGPILEMAYDPNAHNLIKVMRNPVAPELAVSILRQLAYALKDMHDAGFVHRDVKPGNVLLNAKGHIQVLDFDTAIERTAPEGPGRGTRDYMPPELTFVGVYRPSRRQDTYGWQRIAGELMAALDKNDPRYASTAEKLRQLEDRSIVYHSAEQVIADLERLFPPDASGRR